MSKRVLTMICIGILSISTKGMLVHAATIFVPNGDFETPPADPNLDGDNDYSTGDISPPWNGDNYLRNTNEAFTRPSSFVLGWQSNGPADTDDGIPTDDGKFGLQQPRSGTGTNQLYYARTEPAGSVPTGDLVAPFNGDLIGFVNMDDGDGLDQEIQSVTLGNLTPGKTYILKVAVGGRAGQNWNDVGYDIMLVANPTDGDGTDNKFGSAGGTILGTPSSVTLAPHSLAPGSNIADLVYSYTATASDPFAIRIATHNMKMQDGVIDPNDPSVGGDGTNYRFTQGNIDNVRLEAVPEPATIAMVIGLLGLVLSGVRFRDR